MEVQVGPNVITIHADDEVLVCEHDARMSSTKEQGYFASDTRFVSGYRLKIGRVAPVILNSSAVTSDSCRFEFTNPDLVGARGGQIPKQTLHLRVDRILSHGVHEDYDLTNYGREPVELDLEISIECDFADIFDVKEQRLIRRGYLQTEWSEGHSRLTATYRNETFVRGFVVQAESNDSDAEFANGGILFRVSLEPGESWHTCLFWMPAIEEGRRLRPTRACHSLMGGDSEREQARRAWVEQATVFATSDPVVTSVVRQAVDDLAGLRMHIHDERAGGGRRREDDPDAWVPAAGVPWFLSLFGRDALVTSLQTLALSPRFALGALRALGTLQGDEYDDERDLQPGKIEHEIRHGELAALGLIPHRPYYGTHEATTLYVWAAAQAWRWHGDRDALDEVRPHVERALAWIDEDGDIDGDGLQEYRTRAAHGGYYNQGWKDSGEAIVGADGSLAELPIALCEHQGYVAAAKRAWATAVEEAYEDTSAAQRLRADADRIVELLEDRFWWEDEGTYYLGLDGAKRPIESVTSNPGHLLWAHVVAPDRARAVARRLLADDMWSGWGIRTLSAEHVAYNPFSYQVGSVWPHDNAICAAGFRNYGLDDDALQVARGLFDAAARFTNHRLPELFAGLTRDEPAFPVQYLGANVPQAWAAGAVVHLVTALLGLEADAPGRKLLLRPCLPDWLTSVSMTNLGVGGAAVDLTVSRDGDGEVSLDCVCRHGKVEVDFA